VELSPPPIRESPGFDPERRVRTVDVMNTLIRPRNGRLLAGVCAGIADRFGWSRTFVRIAWVILSFFPGPLWIAYVVLWILMPNQGSRR
jgi:phage shock protein C